MVLCGRKQSGQGEMWYLVACDVNQFVNYFVLSIFNDTHMLFHITSKIVVILILLFLFGCEMRKVSSFGV